MPKLPGISHAQALRCSANWVSASREGKHTIMSNGKVRLTIPRHNPINSFTMADIARDAGLTPEQFKDLL